jgi:hypothetical protein
MRISRQQSPVKIMIDQKQNVLVKLNVGLLWLKLHSTRRGLFLLAHLTWN